jgi:hypothetical protein
VAIDAVTLTQATGYLNSLLHKIFDRLKENKRVLARLESERVLVQPIRETIIYTKEGEKQYLNYMGRQVNFLAY